MPQPVVDQFGDEGFSQHQRIAWVVHGAKQTAVDLPKLLGERVDIDDPWRLLVSSIPHSALGVHVGLGIHGHSRRHPHKFIHGQVDHDRDQRLGW